VSFELFWFGFPVLVEVIALGFAFSAGAGRRTVNVVGLLSIPAVLFIYSTAICLWDESANIDGVAALGFTYVMTLPVQLLIGATILLIGKRLHRALNGDQF